MSTYSSGSSVWGQQTTHNMPGEGQTTVAAAEAERPAAVAVAAAVSEPVLYFYWVFWIVFKLQFLLL